KAGQHLGEGGLFLRRVLSGDKTIEIGITHDCWDSPYSVIGLEMASEASSFETSALPPARVFRLQDFAWLLFIAVLIATTPETNYNATILLVIIGAFQIIEPRLKVFSSPRGQITSIVLKLVLCYLLVGYTHGVTSYYY